MPTLTFEVDNQRIWRTDNFYVVSGTDNYLYAHFTFTSDWGDGTKTAQFYAECSDDPPYDVILDQNGVCKVPWEVLQYGDTRVRVDVFAGDRITTNYAVFRVHQDGYMDGGSSSQPPTPDVYAQIIDRLDDVEQMQAVAETLPTGASATASFDHGLLTLGIPTGPQGEKGHPGEVTEEEFQELTGRVDDLETNIRKGILSATKEEWNSQISLIAEEGTLYVYTNQYTNEDGKPVPAFKIGDGRAYLIDLPFNSDITEEHIRNTVIHINQQERNFWSNKVTVYINAQDPGNLIFAKE